MSVSLTLAATAALLTLSSYLAVTCLIDNITVFAALTVVFPILCVAIASFFSGVPNSVELEKGTVPCAGTYADLVWNGSAGHALRRRQPTADQH